MMSDEIEEGELNSDTDIYSENSKHEFKLTDIEHNTEECNKNFQEPSSCCNPYDEEDVS